MTTTKDQGQTAIVDRIPTWATSVQLEPDGYVLFSRVVSEHVEVQRASYLVVDQEARTVSYQPVDGLQLWIPGVNNSLSPEKARRLLVDLQDLLAVVDAIEARLGVPRIKENSIEEIRVKASDYRGGGVHVPVPDRLGADVAAQFGGSASVLAWASCYVADDIEVWVAEGARCSREEVEQLQAMLARALVEFDKRNLHEMANGGRAC